MNDEPTAPNPTPYEKAVKRIAAELQDRHTEAVNAANAALGDGKHGTIAPAIRDFEQEARDLFERSLATIVQGHVLNAMCCEESPRTQQWDQAPVPPPPGPPRR